MLSIHNWSGWMSREDWLVSFNPLEFWWATESSDQNSQWDFSIFEKNLGLEFSELLCKSLSKLEINSYFFNGFFFWNRHIFPLSFFLEVILYNFSKYFDILLFIDWGETCYNFEGILPRNSYRFALRLNKKCQFRDYSIHGMIRSIGLKTFQTMILNQTNK